jgi:predicted transcriptional regulator
MHQNRGSKARHERFRCYLLRMNRVSRTLEIDADTDTRLRKIATERGKDVASVLAEAVALLDSVVDVSGPDIAEDRDRYDEFNRTGLAIPLDDVKAWTASWGSAEELPRPEPRKVK